MSEKSIKILLAFELEELHKISPDNTISMLRNLTSGRENVLIQDLKMKFHRLHSRRCCTVANERLRCRACIKFSFIHENQQQTDAHANL